MAMAELTAYPFILASARDVHVAQGLHRVVTAARPEDLSARVQHLLSRSPSSEAPGVVVGALPFRMSQPARLYQPERWTRPLPSAGHLGPRFWPASPLPRPSRWTVAEVPPREDYEKAVARAVGALRRAHGLRKVVLARTLELTADVAIDPSAVFAALCSDRAVTAFSVPLAPCADGGRRVLIGATPELLVSRTGLAVSSRPLAGSARRHPSDPTADRRQADELARSAKDLVEHATVIEWIADRLTPFCRSLRVPRSPSLVSTASMWHLGSTIEGTLRSDDTTALDLALALHPTPAVCGMPFENAIDVIDQLEHFNRGFYSGAVGWTDRMGDGEWHVAIRCAELCNHTARLFAGAGIVAGSSPVAEGAETAAKFTAMLAALGVDPKTVARPDAAR
jgi:isochorismate synthase